MWWMIRSVVEVAANVSKFYVKWYGQHRSLPADQDVQKRDQIIGSYFHNKLNSRS